MGFHGHNPDHPYRSIRYCQCAECVAGREPAPPVTEEMRAKWRAMGLVLDKTPKKTSRQDHYGTLPEPKDGW